MPSTVLGTEDIDKKHTIPAARADRLKEGARQVKKWAQYRVRRQMERSTQSSGRTSQLRLEESGKKVAPKMIQEGPRGIRQVGSSFSNGRVACFSITLQITI